MTPLRLLALTIGLAAPSTPSSASTVLFGIDLTALGTQDGLLSVNTLNARTELIGLTGEFAIRDIAWDGRREQLFATNRPSSEPTHELLTLNVTSGVATRVGDLTGAQGTIRGLAYDTLNDVLWGVAKYEVGLPSLEPSRLVRIDPTTGAVTDIGSTSPRFNELDDIRELTYDHDNDVLYGFEGGGLVTLDRATGVATSVGGVTHQFDPFDRLNPESMAYFEGQIYSNHRGELVRINLDTMQFREINDFNPTYDAGPLAFQIAVPEPGRMGLLALGMVTLVARRRRS
jgi:hypothetical protein